MKPIILGANVGTGLSITAGKFVAKDGAGAVKQSDTAATEIGIAESSQIVGNSQYVGKIGVIKQGLVKQPTLAVIGTYYFGQVVEVQAGGQGVQPLDKGVGIGTVAETKVTTADDNYLLVYVDFA